MKPWFFIQHCPPYVDFDKEVLGCDDDGYTSLDVQLTFNTETHKAYMTVAWHNDDGNTQDLSENRGIDWNAALRLIETDVPEHILKTLEAVK